MAIRTGDTGAQRLHDLGYKQELKRELNLFTNFAVSFSIISILTGLTTQFGTGLNNGGPVVMVWGWVLVCFFSFIVGLSMAEICSSFPTTGGLYFWSAKLAGPKYGPFASWITGWFNLLGQVAVTAGIDFSLAQVISVMILLSTRNSEGVGYVCNKATVLGIYAAILTCHALLNTFGVNWLNAMNSVSVVWHVVGTIVLVIMIPAMAPTHQSASYVFGHFEYLADAGLGTSFYVFLVGLLMSQYTVTGFDASAHMSEETKNADVSGPLGILLSIIVSFVVGLAYILALLFSIQDPSYIVDTSNETGGYAGAQVFFDAFHGRYGSGTGAVVSLGIIVGAIFFCGLSSVTSNSRMVWAFSRDGALPFSSLWHHVHPKFKVPVNAVWLSGVLSFLLGLPSLHNTVAFYAVTSIAVIGLYISYGLPILFKLVFARKTFVRGPFHLGAASDAVGLVAILWICFITVIFVLPTAYPVTQQTFNYAPAAVGGTIALAGGYWVLDAHRWFKGPISNVTTEEYTSTDAKGAF